MKKGNRKQIKNSTKYITTYTRAKMIDDVARSCRTRLSLVEKIYDEIETHLFELLSSAKDNEDVAVNLFEGISLKSTYLPEREKINNITGEKIMARKAIKVKADISRVYKDKVTAYAMRDMDGR